MKKVAWILLFLSLTLLIIGVDQSMANGLQNSYWIFMFSLALLFIFWYLKGPKTSGNKNE
jgi:hypothetical protein